MKLLIVMFFLAGSYRWPVKTLRDFSTMEPKRATVCELNRLQASWEDSVSGSSGRLEAERQCFRVTGKLEAAIPQDDGDLHLIIRDRCYIVGEIPAPEQLPWLYRSLVRQARAEAAKLVGRRITISGYLFFDKPHKVNGAADNGAEIHPVLEVREAK